MTENSLRDALAVVAADPRSGASLTLYALIATLEYEAAGCLFKLTKLRDLDEKDRLIAYGLMEQMANGANSGDQWDEIKQKMDQLIRQG